MMRPRTVSRVTLLALLTLAFWLHGDASAPGVTEIRQTFLDHIVTPISPFTGGPLDSVMSVNGLFLATRIEGSCGAQSLRVFVDAQQVATINHANAPQDGYELQRKEPVIPSGGTCVTNPSASPTPLEFMTGALSTGATQLSGHTRIVFTMLRYEGGCIFTDQLGGPFCNIVPGWQDFNGDGDPFDYVIAYQVLDLDTSTKDLTVGPVITTNVQADGMSLATDGTTIASFLTESSITQRCGGTAPTGQMRCDSTGTVGADLDGDGFILGSGRTLRVFSIDDPNPSSPRVGNTGLSQTQAGSCPRAAHPNDFTDNAPVQRVSIANGIVAFESDEQAAADAVHLSGAGTTCDAPAKPARSYNGDGDTLDRVIRWFRVSDLQVADDSKGGGFTWAPANPSVGPVVVDRASSATSLPNTSNVIGLDGTSIAYTVHESGSGPEFPPNCTDLTHDCDVSDDVLQIYTIGTGSITNTGAAVSVGLGLPHGATFANGVVSFLTLEGADTQPNFSQPTTPDENGDGDANDVMLRAYDVASHRVIKTNVTMQNTGTITASGYLTGTDGTTIAFLRPLQFGITTAPGELHYIRLSEGVTVPGGGGGSGGSSVTKIVTDTTTSGWFFSNDGVPVGVGEFVPGPAPAPLGTGSVHLALDATGRELIGTFAYAGVRLSQFTNLQYRTYRQSADPSNTLAISLQMDVDYDLTDTNSAYQGRLVFEPYQTAGSGGVVQNTWQTWNPMSGKWWATGLPGRTICPQSSPCTWSAVLAAFPNAGIWPTTWPANPGLGGGFMLKAGGPWPNFSGYADALVVAANGVTTTYDFDPVPADTTPPTLTLPSNITAEATSLAGALVPFVATATDALDGARPVTCVPSSGSTFPIATTTVTCSASDLSGNTATGTFTVTVTKIAQTISFGPLADRPAGSPDFSLAGAAAVGNGAFHSCAVVNGGVQCWGLNSAGQLGDGTTTNRSTPVTVAGLTNVRAVVAGFHHTCALVAGGGVKCWGHNLSGEVGNGTFVSPVFPPTDVIGLTSGVLQISAGAGGDGHTCALLADHTVKCWGYNSSGELGDGTNSHRATPVAVLGLSNVDQISAGGTHSCALVSGGVARCWGRNVWGTLGDGTTTDSSTPVNVLGLTPGVLFIMGGGDHTCAILADRTARCWGYNGFGELGNGTLVTSSFPVTVSGLTNVSAMTGGAGHTCALLTDGTLRCWGLNANGELGDGTTTQRSLPTAPVLSNVLQVTAGADHTCTLSSDATTRCSGYNLYGQVGDGTTTNRLTQVAVSGLSAVASVYATSGLPVTLSAAGVCSVSGMTVHLTGAGTCTITATQPGDALYAAAPPVVRSFVVQDTTPPVFSTVPANKTVEATSAAGAVVPYANPTATDAVDGVITVACTPPSGSTFGLGTTTATCTASDTQGNMASSSFTVTVQDTTPPSITGVPATITAAATSASGALVTYTNPTAADLVDGARPVTCSLASGSTFPLGTSTVTCTAADTRGNSATASFLVNVQDTSAPTLTLPANITTVVNSVGGALVTFTATASDVVDGARPVACTPLSGSTFAIGTTTVTCSASDTHGNTASANFTVTVNQANTTTSLVSSINPSEFGQPVTITATVAVVAPGAGTPTGTVQFMDSGVPIGGMTVGAMGQTVAAGQYHTCAITSGGSVKCWGLNANGQLGDGTTSDHSTPVSVSALSGIIAIAGQGDHTCALTGEGLVKCWGNNATGQLGDGTTTSRLTPVGVSGLSGVTAISASSSHSCAVLTGGSVKCWGWNFYGELGDGTTSDRSTPVTVAGLSNAVAVAAADKHTCALTTSGGVKCWGNNDYGELGDGTTTAKLVPTNVSGLSGITGISVGWYHVCAITSGGALKCWGRNNDGQLGDNTTFNRTTPVNVFGLSSGVTAVSGGKYHTCAVMTSGAAKCWGFNTAGQLGDDTTTSHAVPAPVSGLASGVVAVTAGAYHSCALITEGAVECTGFNFYGQLGDGTTLNSRLTPVMVSGLLASLPGLPPSLTLSNLTVGTHAITAVYSGDANYAGSTSPALTQIVTDSTPPVISSVPGNITKEATSAAGAVVTYTSPSVNDAVDGALPPSCAPASGSIFPLGLTTVTCTATDAAHNTSTATFTVTVQDTTPPAISGVPANISVATTSASGAIVTYTSPTASDLVDGARPVTCLPASGSTFPETTTTVTCTSTDTRSNGSAASFTVSVTNAAPSAGDDAFSTNEDTPLVVGPARILFASTRSGHSQIYVMDADGSQQTRLTNNGANDFGARWSPDRKKIVFSSDRTGFSEVYLMDADGSHQVNLTNSDPAQDVTPSWSADGTRIRFVSNRSGRYEIWSMNTDGSNPVNANITPLGDDGPFVWSPDGTRIAFVSGRDGTNEIYVMNADGSHQVRLTQNVADEQRPAWSPDSSRISFTSTRDGNNEIYVMNVDGSSPIRLTNDSGEDDNSTWSPDGARILFNSNRTGNSEIFVMNADGSTATNLTNAVGQDAFPEWGLWPASVLSNDVDVDSPALTAALVTGTSHGTVVLSPDGSFTYTPNPDFNGTDSFTYKASDGIVDSGPATVTITVNAVNDPPSFSIPNPGVTIAEDAGTQSIAGFATNISAGPNEIGQDSKTFAIASNSHPSLFSTAPAIDSTGTLTFRSASNANGSATLTVTLRDAGGTANGGVDTSAPQTFTITVTAVNDAPIAYGATIATNEDTPIVITLTGNDNDSPSLTFIKVSNPSHGSAVVGPGPTATYTPSPNYNGPDSFIFKLNDGSADSNTALVAITVTAVNDTPSFTKGPNQSVNAGAGAQTVPNWATSIIAGPADEAQQALDFIVGNDAPSLFSALPVIAADGTLTYTPGTAAKGSATVSVQLHDDGGTANGGVDTSAAQTFTITINDTTPPVISNVPANMTVEATSAAGAVATYTNPGASDVVDGAVTVTCLPASGSTFALGTTAVNCSASDSSGNTASASFNVLVQDTTAPVVQVPSAGVSPREATNAAGAAVTFSVSASDSVDGSVTSICSPASGTTFAVGTTTVNCTATDAHGNTSTASFTVLVTDTTPPVVTVPADLNLDTQGLSGRVVTFTASATDLVSGTIAPVCSPASGVLFPINQTTTVTCTATDGRGNSASKTFSVTIFNVAPMANADTGLTDENTPVTISNVLANDTDSDGGVLTVAGVSPTSAHGGTVTRTGNVLTYTPPANYTGADTFTYTLSDGQGGTATGTVTVSISRLSRFVVFSVDMTWLKNNVTVVTGDVGANQRVDPNDHDRDKNIDDGSNDDVTVRLGENVTLQQAGSRVIGDTVRVENKVSIYNLVDNFTIDKGKPATILGAISHPMTVPFTTLPAMPAIAPGTANIDVAKNGTLSLAAGAYGTVRVREGGTLILSGGLYQLVSLDVDQKATVLFHAATELRIKTELDTDSHTKLILDPAVTGLRASQVVIYVAGQNKDAKHHAKDGDDDGGPAIVSIGDNNVVQANIYAPTGTLWIKSKTQATGAFIGEDVRIGEKTTLTLDSAFKN